ncbi:hypothetical protein EXS65_03560 [Candidatus Peribacteria bacterium]|nr:hypothetical protein [Candidatus Peribacteria bacterium]
MNAPTSTVVVPDTTDECSDQSATILPAMAQTIHRNLAELVDLGSGQNGKTEVLRRVQVSIIDYVRQLQSGRPLLSPKDEKYLAIFFSSLARERGARAADVESFEVYEAGEIANAMFQSPVFSMMCVDGRINPTLVFGMIARMNGGVKETPAGDTNDFANAVSGGVILLPKSSTSELMSAAFEKYDGINQVLDSHLACAAREKHSVALGEPIADHGLMRDVLRKRDMANAMRRRVELHHPGKKVTPMQISYDPHEGHLFMGLETEQALQAAREGGSGFTEEVLADLTQRGAILHTKALIENTPEIRDAFLAAFRGFRSTHDWKEQYRFTALQFWKAIQTMRPILLPIIIEKLTADTGPFSEGLPDAELEDRATLLLSAAFNGYCNNGGPEPRHFEFADHKETFVQVSKRDFRPCRNMGFSVDSTDLANLSANVEFASTIVRANRSTKRVEAPAEYSAESFAAAPVGVTIKEIVTSEVSEEQWEVLNRIDWTFLQKLPATQDWTMLTKGGFIEELATQNAGISIDLALALNNLREMMAALYDNRQGCRELLTSGKLVALPMLTDKNRRFRLIVPFFLKGFPDADV